MKTRHWTLIIGAVLCGLALAQTRLPTIQMKGPRVSSVEVLVALPDGRVFSATLGPGLALTGNPGSGFSLSAVVPPLQSARLTRSESGSYTLPDPSAAVYRNGLRQLLAEDYTVIGGTTLKFNTDDLSDIVVAEWRK